MTSESVLDVLRGDTHLVDLCNASVYPSDTLGEGTLSAWRPEIPANSRGQHDYVLHQQAERLLERAGVDWESELAFEVYDDDE